MRSTRARGVMMIASLMIACCACTGGDEKKDRRPHWEREGRSRAMPWMHRAQGAASADLHWALRSSSSRVEHLVRDFRTPARLAAFLSRNSMEVATVLLSEEMLRRPGGVQGKGFEAFGVDLGVAPPSPKPLIHHRVVAATLIMRMYRGCASRDPRAADPLRSCYNAFFAERLGGLLLQPGGRVHEGRLKIILDTLPRTINAETPLLGLPDVGLWDHIMRPARDYLRIWELIEPQKDAILADYQKARQILHPPAMHRQRNDALLQWYRRYTIEEILPKLREDDTGEQPTPKTSTKKAAKAKPTPKTSKPSTDQEASSQKSWTMWHEEDRVYLLVAFWLRRMHDGTAPILVEHLRDLLNSIDAANGD